MRNYKNENSGVNSFELGADYIILRFGSYYYLYSTKTTGAEKVQHMKELAIKGKGLSTYISRVVRKSYEATFSNEKKLKAYLRRRD